MHLLLRGATSSDISTHGTSLTPALIRERRESNAKRRSPEQPEFEEQSTSCKRARESCRRDMLKHLLALLGAADACRFIAYCGNRTVDARCWNENNLLA